MAVKLSKLNEGRTVTVEASGRLSKADYRELVPTVERLIQEYGRIRVLFDMHDFHGWSMGGLWADLKFDARHHADIERLALVGEKKWEKWMARVCQPFTKAQIRYFDRSQADQAHQWITAN